ncbi:glycosyltransferase family 2 protein [Changchengzhania lutea]|uniref:glycosyltransferase family 2 protein n=1 Tax=Changchengzhania lutea TaxID=2049305 RepID=UPI00115CCFD5|nr:glycosyltransferase family 2 protein [Changchengzhania lutea]
MTPFFSVIIPLYNKENFIEKTLQSVYEQKFTDFEIIIVDDGSTDNSLSVAKKKIENFKNTTLIHQENKGLSATRNTGIRASKGKLVALLDADDLWDNQFLSTIKALYNEYSNASVFGVDYLERHSKNIELTTRKNIPNNLKNTSFIVNAFLEANMQQPLFCQSSVAYKKEVFNHIQFNTAITYAEDIDFNILIHLQKHQVAYRYKPLAIIRLNIDNQLSTQSISDKTLPNLDAYESFALKDLELKKYLDFCRYFFAMSYKMESNHQKYNQILKNLDKRNINFTQKLYLKLPVFLIKSIKELKKWFLKYNIRLTSFDS